MVCLYSEPAPGNFGLEGGALCGNLSRRVRLKMRLLSRAGSLVGPLPGIKSMGEADEMPNTKHLSKISNESY